MSWSAKHKNLTNFQTKPLTQDAPINHKTPNWEMYRQTLARMKTIRSQSTHWRATCLFNDFRYGSQFGYEDYLRSKFSDFDIMTWNGPGTCQPVEYVNIREHSAWEAQTARFYQHTGYGLDVDSSMSTCDLKANDGAVFQEDNFGFYAFVNDKFRCTRDSNTTTQWWFGGYLGEQ